jgi:type VI secretion system secreted protein Hcp
MAFDAFLKFDTSQLQGESKHKDHLNEIEIFSFSWGETMPPSSAGSTGKVSMQDFSFVSRVQKSSPELFLSCASGAHLKKATLSIRKSGEKSPGDYLIWTFEDILVSSFNQVGEGGEGTTDFPLEEFTLNFSAVTVEYKPELDNGQLGPGIKAGWDLKKSIPK